MVGLLVGMDVVCFFLSGIVMIILILYDLVKKMVGIDFILLQIYIDSGDIVGCLMSNNGDVDYDGDSWFFLLEDIDVVCQIQCNFKVVLSFIGKKLLFGKFLLFVVVQGWVVLVCDKVMMQQYWVKDLECWFDQGVDMFGLLFIYVVVMCIYYWDGEDEGEILC